jgi:hypothetical protein
VYGFKVKTILNVIYGMSVAGYIPGIFRGKEIDWAD